MDDHRSHYERFVQPIENQMMRCVWRVVQDSDEAIDAFQDAMTRIVERFDDIERHLNPRALILCICTHAAYSRLRQSIARRKHEASAPFPEVADPAVGAIDRLAAREQQRIVLEAVSRLPCRQAETVLMRLLLEWPYSDIAQALGCDEATARTHFMRGRDRLRRVLAPLIEPSSQEASHGQ